jgi:hypothetical protein
MKLFMKQSRRINPSLLLLGLLIQCCEIVRATEHSPAPEVKFEVVSVRVLSAKEAADRSPDFIGPNVAVRLRLSSTGQGLFFYTWGESIVPIGYSVRWIEHGMVWRFRQTENQSSPGIRELDALVPGSWRLLSGHYRPAIEWEQLDSTRFAGEKHAFTIFVKDREGAEPREIVSDPFIVPARAP